MHMCLGAKGVSSCGQPEIFFSKRKEKNRESQCVEQAPAHFLFYAHTKSNDSFWCAFFFWRTPKATACLFEQVCICVSVEETYMLLIRMRMLLIRMRMQGCRQVCICASYVCVCCSYVCVCRDVGMYAYASP